MGRVVITGMGIYSVIGKNLAEVCGERVFNKFGLKESSFIPWRESQADSIFGKRQIVSTEFYPWLGKKARGIVHDENSYVMGGVSIESA